MVIIQEAVEEHQKVFDPDNPRDLIDEYLLDLKNKKRENEKFLRIGGKWNWKLNVFVIIVLKVYTKLYKYLDI